MGIVRYSVKCDGCGAAIVLRLGVGLDQEQPFFYVCASCNAVARGKLILTGPGSTHLELNGGELVTMHSNNFQVVTLHPDLPSVMNVDSFDPVGGSPFLLQHELLGNRFEEFYKRLRSFRGTVDKDWVAFRRWFGYYLDQNWDQFDKEGEKLLGELWKVPRSDFDRHHIVHLAMELLTAPLWVQPCFSDMKEDIAKAAGAASMDLSSFAVSRLTEVIELQRDLFHCLELFVDNRSGILPGLAVELYKKGDDAAQKDLRLLRDDFPLLRDFYIAAFEAAHNTLTFVVAIDNIRARKDPNAFPTGGPKSLKAFSKLSNADKAKVLETLDLKAWNSHWKELLDRSIRNAIGHHSIRHDLRSGMLISRDSAPIPYLIFVVKAFRMLHAILATEIALKYLRMAASLREHAD